MATPDTNMTSRGPNDVNGNHTPHSAASSRLQLQSLNTFQFVSQLVSATPPYLFNMQSPFPGNFFSDLLRRMAPRAGTPGMPPDAQLQQHIRAALLAKGTPPPTLPQSIMPPPLDLAALAAQQRHQQTLPPTSSAQEKGIKRSLFSDISALSNCESENSVKRPRLEEITRDERREHTSEALNSSFLMQPPFMPSAVPPPPDVMSHWSARASLMRPQIPIPSPHVPPAPLDPYRLLLDLRLAGQLRSMAANQVLYHKEPSLLSHSPLVPNLTGIGAGRVSPPREVSSTPVRQAKEETPSTLPPHSKASSLRGDDSRVSAFHPPGRTAANNAAVPEQVSGGADTSDDESGEKRSNSRNSTNSSTSSLNKDSLGSQYILKNLTEIYKTIDGQRNENDPLPTAEPLDNKSSTREDILHPISKLATPSNFPVYNNNEISKQVEESNNNGREYLDKPQHIFKEEPGYPNYSVTNGSNTEREKSAIFDNDFKREKEEDEDNKKF